MTWWVQSETKANNLPVDMQHKILASASFKNGLFIVYTVLSFRINFKLENWKSNKLKMACLDTWQFLISIFLFLSLYGCSLSGEMSENDFQNLFSQFFLFCFCDNSLFLSLNEYNTYNVFFSDSILLFYSNWIKCIAVLIN